MRQFIAVLDFEATCDEKDWDLSAQEIIDFPVALIDTQQKAVVDEFHTFVRPTVHPILTPFCKDLTGIKQKEVDGQPTIHEALGQFQEWLGYHDLHSQNTIITTCGDWDLRSMWPRQVALSGITSPSEPLQTPDLFKQWANIKFVFRDYSGYKPSGMKGMLRKAGIKHRGRHHYGIDDVRNLCDLVIWLLLRGADFAPTWQDKQRQKHKQKCIRQIQALEERLQYHQHMLQRLPKSAPEDAHANHSNRITSTQQELLRQQAMLTVYS